MGPGREGLRDDVAGLHTATEATLGDIARVEGFILGAVDEMKAGGLVRTEEVPVASLGVIRAARCGAGGVLELGRERLHEQVGDPERVLEVGRVERPERFLALEPHHAEEGEDIVVVGAEIEGEGAGAVAALVDIELDLVEDLHVAFDAAAAAASRADRRALGADVVEPE